jgi:hypothetical protein
MPKPQKVTKPDDAPGFLKRYLAGEHTAVWDELMSLGDSVHHVSLYPEATAVAAETMRRARHNVESLITKLSAMNYRFLNLKDSDAVRRQAAGRLTNRAQRIADKLDKNNPMRFDNVALLRSEALRWLVEEAEEDSHRRALEHIEEILRKKTAQTEPEIDFGPPLRNPPNSNTAADLARLEELAGGPLPLSLRAWYEQVGGVSLLGWHSTLHPNSDEPAGLGAHDPDPLMIFPPDIAEKLIGLSDLEPTGHDLRLDLAPDAVSKGGSGGSDPYYMVIPDGCADGVFHDGRGRTFVGYLRNAFQWGGFPGWEFARDPPLKAIAQLSRGLMAL